MFDVGAAGIRAAQAQTRGGQALIRDALRIDLPAATNDTTESPDCGRLARILAQGRFRGAGVGLVLSTPEAQFHALQAPPGLLATSPEKVQEALRWEIARETRTEPEELEARYWRLPPGHREGLNVMGVSVSAPLMRQWAEAFAAQDLELRRVDTAPCALARAALRAAPPEARTVWSVVDLGHRRTTIVVLVGDTPVYVRAAAISSQDWTRRIAEAFQVSETEAEQIKREIGIQRAERGLRSSPGAGDPRLSRDLPGLVFNVLRESLDSLVQTVRMCLSYALESYADAAAERVVLVGGGVELPGLADYLAMFLDLDTRVLSTGPDAPNRMDSVSAAAVGAALLDLEAQ